MFRTDRLSALLAVLEQVVEDNGDISLLIMKELEEVVEEDNMIPQALNENEADLKEWKEVNLDKVPLEAKVDDMESTGETEIDRFFSAGYD